MENWHLWKIMRSYLEPQMIIISLRSQCGRWFWDGWPRWRTQPWECILFCCLLCTCVGRCLSVNWGVGCVLNDCYLKLLITKSDCMWEAWVFSTALGYTGEEYFYSGASWLPSGERLLSIHHSWWHIATLDSCLVNLLTEVSGNWLLAINLEKWLFCI